MVPSINDCLYPGLDFKLAFSINICKWFDAYIMKTKKRGFFVSIDILDDSDYQLFESQKVHCRFFYNDIPYWFEAAFDPCDYTAGLLYIEKPKAISVSELRQHERVKTQIPVMINGSIEGSLLDLSLGGALIETDAKLDKIFLLKIEVDNIDIRAITTIARKQQDGKYGVKLISLYHKELLEKHLQAEMYNFKKKLLAKRGLIV